MIPAKFVLGLVALVLVWTVDDVASYLLGAIAAVVIVIGPNRPESDRP